MVLLKKSMLFLSNVFMSYHRQQILNLIVLRPLYSHMGVAEEPLAPTLTLVPPLDKRIRIF